MWYVVLCIRGSIPDITSHHIAPKKQPLWDLRKGQIKEWGQAIPYWGWLNRFARVLN